MMLMGVVCWLARSREATRARGGRGAGNRDGHAAAWTTWRPRWLPWYLESYINGVHTFNVPQSWLFPIFPWTAFAFAGLAVGFLLFSDWAGEKSGRATALCGAAGVGIFYLSSWLDARPVHLYAVYDYWHTSPNFFLARVGILLVIVLGAYTRGAAGARGRSDSAR